MAITNEQLTELSQEFCLSEGEVAYLIKFKATCRRTEDSVRRTVA